MNGCRWQEKSFSVGYDETNHDEFCRCGKIFGSIGFKINGEKVCQDCWDKKEMELVTTEDMYKVTRPKDRLWDFTDNLNFERPIHIHSKRQWENECKKRNLIYRPANDTTQPRKFKSVPIEVKKNLIREEMKSLGIYDSRKLFKNRR